MSVPNKKRVFILGLDGVPYSLLRQFIQDGRMPSLSAIVGQGVLAPMKASLPEVSSTSWTTFMTGVNPAKHGIFGFMDLQKASHNIYFPNSLDIKAPTLWETAGKYQKRSIVLNIPSTYPAKPLNGILTAGFVAVDLGKATYPRKTYEYLKSIGYRMDVDSEKATQDLNAFKDDVDTALKKREEAFKFLLDHEEWDIFIAAVTETDRLHHFFFDAFADQGHPMHDYLMNFYEKIDRLAGYFYKRVNNDDTLFMIISDHGFTAIKQEIYLNSWLKEKGYLSFKTDKPQLINEINKESSAFALDPSRIYINLKGRYANGSVSGDEYEPVRNRIKNELLEFKIGGERVIKKVFFKEEIYSGPYMEYAPDIILLSNDGFDLKGTVRKSEIFGRGVFKGMHTQDDATLFINRNLNLNGTNIMDIAPTVLKFIGCDKEAELMDGKIIAV